MKIVESSFGCLSLQAHFIRTSFAETMSLLSLSIHLGYVHALVLAMNNTNTNFLQNHNYAENNHFKSFRKEAQFGMNT